MPQIQGVECGATGAAGTRDVQGIVNGSAGEVLPDGELHGLVIFRSPKRYQREIRQDGLLDEAQDISRVESRLKWKGGKRGEKFGQAVRGEIPLRCAILHGLQAGKRDRVVRMLLEQRGDEGGCIKTNFHRSEASDFRAALIPLTFNEGSQIPCGRRDFTGANEDAIYLRERRCGDDGTKPDPIGFESDLQFVTGLESKPVAQNFRHH